MLEKSEVYSAQDIELLRKKIAAHKDTLTNLKTEESVSNNPLLKNEFNSFKTQVSYLESIMKIVKGKQNMQLEEYKQKITNLSSQIDSLNQTVEQLNHYFSVVTNKLNNDQNKTLQENFNSSTDVQDSLNFPIKDEIREEDDVNSENPRSILPPSKPNVLPTFKQLRNLSSISISEDNTIQHIPEEEQQHSTNKTFPSKNGIPRQKYNSNYKSIHTNSTTGHKLLKNTYTFTINANNTIPNPPALTQSTSETKETETPVHALSQETKEIQETSTDITQHEATSSTPTNHAPEKYDNDTITNDFQAEHNVTQKEIEKIEEKLVSSDDQSQPDANPSTLTAEKNDTATNDFQDEQMVVQVEIEQVKEKLVSSNDQSQPNANPSTLTAEKNDTVTNDFQDEHTVAQEKIEQVEEISNELVKEENQKKEGFSFWKLFNKKN